MSIFQVLCAMLEFEIIEGSDLKMQIITTLQSTTAGKRMYAQLCERQIALRELVSMVISFYTFYNILHNKLHVLTEYHQVIIMPEQTDLIIFAEVYFLVSFPQYLFSLFIVCVKCIYHTISTRNDPLLHLNANVM